MPLPEKREKESADKWMKRCMNDKNAQREFKQKEHLAYCLKQTKQQKNE